jgi:hypothetical protein
MKLSQLTCVGWCANMLLDRREQVPFTFDDVYAAADKKRLVDLFLKIGSKSQRRAMFIARVPPTNAKPQRGGIASVQLVCLAAGVCPRLRFRTTWPGYRLGAGGGGKARHFGGRWQSEAATPLSHARSPFEFSSAFARSKAPSSLRFAGALFQPGGRQEIAHPIYRWVKLPKRNFSPARDERM